MSSRRSPSPSRRSRRDSRRHRPRSKERDRRRSRERGPQRKRPRSDDGSGYGHGHGREDDQYSKRQRRDRDRTRARNQSDLSFHRQDTATLDADQRRAIREEFDTRYAESSKSRRFIALATPSTARSHAFEYPNGVGKDPHLEFAYECRVQLDPMLYPRDRVLSPDFPRAPYRRRNEDGKSALHWGQRKLLLSEIEFLLLYGHLSSTVVYAGAAEGRHINMLSELFPDHLFHLYDPRKFTCREVPGHIVIHSGEPNEEGDPGGWFTDEVARSYRGQAVLFISDIRTANWRNMTEDEVDRRVVEDNEAQMRWIDLMQPSKSMLKFKLSYRPGQTEYLDGEIFLPVWSPPTTTETRLVPHDNSTRRLYDNTVYEEQMFYFNTVTRLTWYSHDVTADGLCHCYDCRAEVFILDRYVRDRCSAQIEAALEVEPGEVIEEAASDGGGVDPSAQEAQRHQVVCAEVARLSQRMSLALGHPRLSTYVHKVRAMGEDDED